MSDEQKLLELTRRIHSEAYAAGRYSAFREASRLVAWASYDQTHQDVAILLLERAEEESK